MKRSENGDRQNGSQDEIRIGDIFHVIWRQRVLIITLAICGLIIGIVLSIFNYMNGEMKRTYAITSAIAVTSQTKDGLYTNKESTPNSTDITLAENMTDSVIYVIKSDKTLEKAIRRLSLVGISVADIYKNLNVSKYGSTQIIEMTLYWRNAEEGVEILNAINGVAPQVLAEVLQIGNVSVVNNPKSQYRIGGSVNAKLWVLMIIAGIGLGIGLAVMDMFLRPRLIEPMDMTTKFQLRLLGEIPEDPKTMASSYPTIAPFTNPLMEEKFSSMARILEYEVRESKNRCFCVTASSSREGVSTMASRLAYRLGEMERKVLLVDLNLQDPMLGHLLDEAPDYYHSLNGLYYGDSARVEAVHHLTQYLDLLPSVMDPRYPLFMNEDLNGLLKNLAADYEYVLIDLPAVKESSDVMSMRSLTDQVLFVSRCDAAFFSDIEDALDRMEKAGMRIVGCIANGMSPIREKATSKKTTSAGHKAGGRKAAPHACAASAGVRADIRSGLSKAASPLREQTEEERRKVLDDSLARGFEEYRT